MSKKKKKIWRNIVEKKLLQDFSLSETSCKSARGPAKWHSNFAFSLFLPISLSFFIIYLFIYLLLPKSSHYLI